MTTQASLDLKKTVNLPSKDLPMKGNLTQAEPARLKRWAEVNLYNEIRKARAGRDKFLLHDGPPYANGKIHMGTAFNKILKDFLLKSRVMLGYDVPYIPGYDCHGLPIEKKVEDELGKNRFELSALEIRRAARKFAEKHIKQMNVDFQRLGVFGEWSKSYQTMSFDYQAAILRSLAEFVKMGSVYRGLRPVHWSIGAQSALAEAELEYKDKTDPSVYVAFPLKTDPAELDPALAGKSVSIVIWTTTPWTLPANLGISFGPEFDYVAVEVGSAVYVVAEALLEAVSQKVGWINTTVLARFKGNIFDRKVARHPWIDRDSLLMVGDHVTLEAGTGCVHTAPGHGAEDFFIGKEYGLEAYCPVDGSGRLTDDVEHFAGMQVFEANPKIVAFLKETGKLLHVEEFLHSYPHCWRTKTPTIFRATPQWFISMDGVNLRQKALEAIKTIEWLPKWGDERMTNMFKDRGDWCISRQRAWGVPIAAFRCTDCGYEHVNPEFMNRVADVFEKQGADSWYARDLKDFLEADFACPGCGSTNFEKETDILDVWLDSGTSWQVMERAGLCKPEEYASDVYLEGSDQYRGWFNSSLVVALGLRNHAPYKAVITHGYVLVDKEKMSKSIGNVIEPQDLINKSGADILRLWVASLDYTGDVRISDEILARISDAYRKIRNTACYLVNNLYDFNLATDAVPFAEMMEIDRWALVKVNALVKKVRECYEAYDFQGAYFALYGFCTTELSSVYFDVLKDRLYTYAPKSFERRSAQTGLYEVAQRLTRLLAPFAVFTADEIWEKLPAVGERAVSVHTTEFPTYDENLIDEALTTRWDALLEVRTTVLKALEETRIAGQIGAALEAHVTINAGGEAYQHLAAYGEENLSFLFIASKVTLVATEGELSVKVSRAEGEKCERCWHYETNVGSDARYPTICGRCATNVEAGWTSS
ncbi:MAG: isoleucine--tRNA ligase [Blastocatellia bacterium]|nr:isoleucine--tRNA ligase [Blastocatellia bacterium]